VYGRPRYERVKDDDLKRALEAFPRQALHAERIAFRHPSSNEPMEIVAPVPSDLAALIGQIDKVSTRRLNG
jgi:23S rRNA pseudouridine1911/1915/1917 synthase